MQEENNTIPNTEHQHMPIPVLVALTVVVIALLCGSYLLLRYVASPTTVVDESSGGDVHVMQLPKGFVQKLTPAPGQELVEITPELLSKLTPAPGQELVEITPELLSKLTPAPGQAIFEF